MKIRIVAPCEYRGKHYTPGQILELGKEQIKWSADWFERQGFGVKIEIEATAQKKIEPWSLKDVFHWKKDKNYIIQDFLLPKTVNMLFSPPSGYKSLLSLDACICVAAGEPWLGLKTKKGKVLILDRENSNKDIRDRVVSLVNGHGWCRRLRGIQLNLLIRQGMLTDDTFLDDLHDYVKENRVSLVVIDTLRRFSSFEENSSDDMNKLYAAFQKIIDGSSTAIMFLHHTNKDETNYRGSVDLLGQVDTAYRVGRNKKENRFKIVCEKSRSGEIDEIQGIIEWDKEKERTIITREDLEDKEKEDSAKKWKSAKFWALEHIQKLCPVAGHVFMRAQLFRLLEAENMDKLKEEQVSKRTMERLLGNLVLRHYLAQTGLKGEYRRLFAAEGGVFEPQGGRDSG